MARRLLHFYQRASSGQGMATETVTTAVDGQVLGVELSALSTVLAEAFATDDQAFGSQDLTGRYEMVAHVGPAQRLTKGTLGLGAYNIVSTLSPLALALGLPGDQIIEGAAIPPGGDLTGFRALANGFGDVDIWLLDREFEVLELEPCKL